MLLRMLVGHLLGERDVIPQDDDVVIGDGPFVSGLRSVEQDRRLALARGIGRPAARATFAARATLSIGRLGNQVQGVQQALGLVGQTWQHACLLGARLGRPARSAVQEHGRQREWY
jgi:hypothetical protein